MGTTRRGLPVGTDDRDAIEAIDTFTDLLCAIRPGPEVVLRDAATWPEVAMLQLGAAMLHLYGQTTADAAEAALHLGRAHALAPAMVEREQLTLAALDRWAAGDHLVAAEALEDLLARWPRDLLALKALEFLYYLLGQQHFGARFLDRVERLADGPNRDDPDFLAVWAFASELSGAPGPATELAERALARRADTAWAHHALAHVLITEGDPPAALARLRSFLPSWSASGRVIHGHNAWHLAIAHLDQLDVAGADEVFREHVWGVLPDTPGEQIDAISYLWRVELLGDEVEARRWAEVADHVEARAGECVFPFLSAHHAYALARAGRSDALTMLRASVARRTERDDGEARRVWRPVGRAVVEACIAFGLGDHARAASLLEPVMPGMTAIGGSDAQDDLFRQAYLTALVAAGRRADARARWEAMTRWKVRSPLDEHFAAMVAG